MVRRTKEDSERTRAKLLDAAEKLFVKKGVGETSLDDIARAAGMTRGAFYWHFADKGEVFRAMHERVKLPLDKLFDAAAKSKDAAEALREAFVFALTSLQTDKRTYNVFTILLLLKCGQADACPAYMERMAEMRDAFDKRLLAVFKSMRKQGTLAKHTNPRIAALAAHAMMVGVCMDFLRHAGMYDMKKDAPKIVDAFLSGILAATK